MKLLLSEIAKATGGELIGEDKVINSISRDSRQIGENCLYVPLKGEKFDGHDFIDKACEGGATAVLTERENEEYAIPLVRVKDTRLALGDIARFYRQKLGNLKIVAITGSVGKTTTKDMTASVISQKYNTVKTQGNYNNDIGVPLTVFSFDENTEAAVVEMGMNHFNEIEYLSSIALPDIAIITNVGVSHIENLGSREGILQAKCEIFSHMKEDSLKILNGDDDMLITVADKYKNICFAHIDSEGELYADNVKPKGLKGTDCVLHIGDITIPVSIPVAGRHMVLNALLAGRAGVELGLSPEEIKRGIEQFKPTAMRMDVFDTDDYTVINDAYNANPQSVKASLDVLASCEGRKCAVLGDMFELGKNAPQYHAEVGEYAALKGIDLVVCIGELSENMYRACIEKGGKAFYFGDMEEFTKKISSVIPKGSAVLVKASRGMHFEKIIEKLRSEQI